MQIGTGHIESDMLCEILETYDVPVYGAVLRKLLESCRDAHSVEYSSYSVLIMSLEL